MYNPTQPFIPTNSRAVSSSTCSSLAHSSAPSTLSTRPGLQLSSHKPVAVARAESVPSALQEARRRRCLLRSKSQSLALMDRLSRLRRMRRSCMMRAGFLSTTSTVQRPSVSRVERLQRQRLRLCQSKTFDTNLRRLHKFAGCDRIEIGYIWRRWKNVLEGLLSPKNYVH
jgi:hypothetical protein